MLISNHTRGTKVQSNSYQIPTKVLLNFTSVEFDKNLVRILSECGAVRVSGKWFGRLCFWGRKKKRQQDEVRGLRFCWRAVGCALLRACRECVCCGVAAGATFSSSGGFRPIGTADRPCGGLWRSLQRRCRRWWRRR